MRSRIVCLLGLPPFLGGASGDAPGGLSLPWAGNKQAPARARLRFTLLNDEFRYAAAGGSLAALVGGTAAAKATSPRLGLALEQAARPTVYVIDIDPEGERSRGGGGSGGRSAGGGDDPAAALSEKVSFLLSAAGCDTARGDEVVLRVTSPGGAVHTYGALAAEADRLRAGGLAVTACIDTVAASGGYMVACTAPTIIAGMSCTRSPLH